MTYSETMNQTDLSTAAVESEASTVEKLKTLAREGNQRVRRINQILRSAFSETRSEFQAGRSVMAPLVKEVTAEAVSGFNETKQQATKVVNEAWNEGDTQTDLSDRMVSFLKAMAATANQNLVPQLKQQALKLDELLVTRYGDQYASLKARFDFIGVWTAANPSNSDSADKPQNNQSEVVIEVDSEAV